MKVRLCYLFNAVFDSQDIPQDWQNGLIVPLFKDGDREVATNYRGITLLSIVGKLFASIIERRLSKWCETNRIFEQEQVGFRPGSTTVHQIFTFAEITRKRKNKHQPTYCCFLDIRKAYDTVWREGLWKKLEAIGVNEKLVKVIKNTYANVRSRVIVNDKLSDWFDIGIGLRQGCVLSPLLFLVFINDC